MKSIIVIDIQDIHFDYEMDNTHDSVQDDTIWLALENEEGLPWDDVMEQQEESDKPRYSYLW
ncbi:hypothetical protein ACFFHT_06580 [Gallibacterium melopsittaci]|uniref:Uncharacterized protein n=1 Tax=Gallibacterium melopsittaci TaxID=516063 RepID=A0ABV6HWH8_9PAST